MFILGKGCVIMPIEDVNNMNSLIIKDDVFFITGASSGLGKIWAEELLKRGYRVVATARRCKSIDYLKYLYPKLVLCLSLDVTSQRSIKKSIAKCIDVFGKIDVFINNAGVGYFGIIENTDIKRAKQVFETNFWGVLETLKIIIPIMRKNKKGIIIQTSSMASFVAPPLASIYAATMASREALFESLNSEMSDFNIKLLLLEFGEFKTNFYKNSFINKYIPEEYNYIYKNILENIYENKYESANNPYIAINNVINILETYNDISLRICIGNDSYKALNKKINNLMNVHKVLMGETT